MTQAWAEHAVSTSWRLSLHENITCLGFWVSGCCWLIIPFSLEPEWHLKWGWSMPPISEQWKRLIIAFTMVTNHRRQLYGTNICQNHHRSHHQLRNVQWPRAAHLCYADRCQGNASSKLPGPWASVTLWGWDGEYRFHQYGKPSNKPNFWAACFQNTPKRKFG